MMMHLIIMYIKKNYPDEKTSESTEFFVNICFSTESNNSLLSNII